MTLTLSKHERMDWNRRWRFTLQDADQVCKRARLKAARGASERAAAVKAAEDAGLVAEAERLRAEPSPEPYNRGRILRGLARIRYCEPRDADQVGPALGSGFLARAERHAASVGPDVTTRRRGSERRAVDVRRAHRRSGSPLSLKDWARAQGDEIVYLYGSRQVSRLSGLVAEAHGQGKRAAHLPRKARPKRTRAPVVKPQGKPEAAAAKPSKGGAKGGRK